MSWSIYNPKTIAINRSKVLSVVKNVYVEMYGTKSGALSAADKPAFVHVISSSLIAECGSWVQGWTWTDGGPITAWCCSNHSVWIKGDVSIDDTAERVANAIQEWYEFLVELDEMFSNFDEQFGDKQTAEHVDHVASYLLEYVLNKTDAEDAWYYTFSTVLTWYLESQNMSCAKVEEEVERICSGDFSSWCVPTDENARRVTKKLGSSVERLAQEHVSDELSNATALWVKTRKNYFQSGPSKKHFCDVIVDKHLEFIDGHDHNKSEIRATRMREALGFCREYALGQQAFTWDLLCNLQEVILGEKVGFRKADAFAKDGRECYPLNSGTQTHFENYLKDANNQGIDIVSRASCVYLDICFFHPFKDGNARAARLAMDYVLSASGYALLSVEPLFLLPRVPNAYSFQSTVASLVGKKKF